QGLYCFMMDRHNEAVSTIVKAVQGFYSRKEAYRIYHGSTNSTRLVTFDPAKIVDVSSLSNILEIDTNRKVALVEPNVPMDILVRATLKHGLLPPVVPEFPGITVGGSFSGTAGESSSFKYGFFDRTVNWCTIVLANGDTIKASPTENPDLFYGATGAFGTLGVTTLFEIQLIPATTYVELTYLPVKNAAEAISAITKASQESYDYIDGILFSLDYGVVMLGRLTSTLAHKIQRFTRAHDPWFYLHVRKAGSTTECIPIQDYLFRYDRGAFWMGAYSFQMFWTPFNRVTRWLLDPLLHTRKMYEALHASGQAQTFIIQDLALPNETAEKFIEYVDQNLSIYPLWLCPLRPDSKAPMHSPPETLFAAPSPASPTTLLINIGVWGPHWGSFSAFKDANRALERKVQELGGLKWLYAHAYYTEDEFWGIYGREWYDGLRAKYHAEGLPSVWEKVKAKEGFVETK
ncbi:MAG: hypothetical protein Q9187_008573, partial [Circinaria calcarea]